MESDIVDILIVDDTPANLKLLSSLLIANGYNARPASSGDLALRSVESKLPDLILLDIKMPNMDGFEVCKRLKASSKSKDIPVIFISALDDVNDKVKAFSVGGVDYITKPFEAQEVLARINTHVTIRSLQNELQTQNVKLKELMKKQQEQESILIEQSKMAAMGEMISAIAHQWRQPLNTLALYVQDVEDAYEHDQLDSDYIHKSVAQSMKQINFMSKTIDDFRDFLRPNKEKEKFQVVDEIQKTIDLLLAQLNSHKIEIAISGDECVLIGLSHEIQQIALNLINNSKDAILELQEDRPDYSGFIKIKVSKRDEFVEISFIDNGGGIEESIQDKVFEPYFTTKFPKNGTGIGLYMVREIIVNHYNGSISVANVNGGVEFLIKIPIDQESVADGE